MKKLLYLIPFLFVHLIQADQATELVHIVDVIKELKNFKPMPRAAKSTHAPQPEPAQNKYDRIYDLNKPLQKRLYRNTTRQELIDKLVMNPTYTLGSKTTYGPGVRSTNPNLQQFIDDLRAEQIWDYYMSPNFLEYAEKVFNEIYGRLESQPAPQSQPTPMDDKEAAKKRIRGNLTEEKFKILLDQVNKGLAPTYNDNDPYNVANLKQNTPKAEFFNDLLWGYFPEIDKNKLLIRDMRLAESLYSILQAIDLEKALDDFLITEYLNKERIKNKAISALAHYVNDDLIVFSFAYEPTRRKISTDNKYNFTKPNMTRYNSDSNFKKFVLSTLLAYHPDIKLSQISRNQMQALEDFFDEITAAKAAERFKKEMDAQRADF